MFGGIYFRNLLSAMVDKKGNRLQFFLSVFIFFSVLVSSVLCEEGFILEYHFVKGRKYNYVGEIRIRDIGGIPTEGKDKGDINAALTFYEVVIPFTYMKEIIDVDEDGVATIRSVRNISLDSSVSVGRDKLSADSFKAIVDFFALPKNITASTRIDRKGKILGETQDTLFLKRNFNLFPEGAVKVGTKKVKILQTTMGFPIEITWEFKKIIAEEGQKIALIRIIRRYQRQEPYNDVFIKIDVEGTADIYFNLDLSVIQRMDMKSIIKKKMVDKRGVLLGGRAQSEIDFFLTQKLVSSD